MGRAERDVLSKVGRDSGGVGRCRPGAWSRPLKSSQTASTLQIGQGPVGHSATIPYSNTITCY